MSADPTRAASAGAAPEGPASRPEQAATGQTRSAAPDAGPVGPDPATDGSATAGEGGQSGITAADRAVVTAQLGRPPRAMRAVAHRCPCGLPDVVETLPRLPDGTPFPTLDYLTCPRASAAAGRLEATGVMREMADRLRTDRILAERYRAAHEAYLARRRQLGDVPEIAGVSAGGMPTRVKCLHALLAHALAAGPGVNPLGDEVRAAVGAWWSAGPCVRPEEGR